MDSITQLHTDRQTEVGFNGRLPATVTLNLSALREAADVTCAGKPHVYNHRQSL